MKFLSKKDNSEITIQGLSYEVSNDRPKINALLLQEQKGFCAYSERYVKNTDATEIEHFDGRLKSTEGDGYTNWYAVLRWMNSHKPKKLDERFLPILHPSLAADRIHYEDGIYVTTNENDEEAKHLIEYLGFNKHELWLDRQKHIKRLKFLKSQQEETFMEYLSNHKEELSFCTAIEVELEINLDDLI